MPNFTTPIPLTLYIHIPWCVRKCPYCDFNSHQVREDIRESHYIDKLIEDLDQDLPKVWGRRLSAIFIGGGTPSLFSPEGFDRLLKAIHARLPFSTDMEITLEANPGTVEQGKFEGYRNAGINRLSIGIQSFNDKHLKKLGRIHNTNEAQKAVECAKNAGFNNYNLDLMYGLPDQTHAEAIQDLSTAIALSSTHLSWYQLTIEPNTLFFHKPPPLPEDDIIWDIQSEGEKLLNDAGFEHYEVSAFAKKQFQSQHNLNYWEFGDYLGIGAGAHSKITNFSNNTVTRYWKTKHPQAYLENNITFIAGEKILNDNDLSGEFMLNALRLKKPIEFEFMVERSGLSLEHFIENINIAKQKEFITIENKIMTKTDLGNRFLNNLIEVFF